MCKITSVPAVHRILPIVLGVLLFPLLLPAQLFGQQPLARSAGGQLLVTPQPLYCGKIPVHSRARRDLILYNIGTQPITVSNIQIEGLHASDYSLSQNFSSFTLQPLDLFVVGIKFTPTTVGTRLAQAVVTSTADGSPHRIDLTGAGTALGSPVITFERIFGGTESDGLGGIQQTPDGGFIVAGNTLLPDEDYTDVYVAKLDAYGAIEWQNHYGGKDNDAARSVCLLPGGGYLVAGTTESYGAGGIDIFLLKLDRNGNLQWKKTFGGDQDEHLSWMEPLSDGTFLLAGTTESFSSNGRDAYLVKVDSSGNKVWDRYFGGSGGESAAMVRENPDHSLIVVGGTTSFGTGDFDVYLVKLSSAGNVVWEKHYGGSDWDSGSCIDLTQDGGYIVGGYTASSGAGARDAYLLKLDASGKEQWSRTFGGTHNDGFSAVRQLPDGGYILAGSSVTYLTAEKQYTDILLVRTDGSGNKVWQRLVGGKKSDSASDLILTDDGGFVIVGTTSSYSKNSDAYIAKLNGDGTVTAVVSHPVIADRYELGQNYPNPFNPVTTIPFSLPESKHVVIAVYNTLGQEVARLLDKTLQRGRYSVAFNAAGLPAGAYFYRLSAGSYSNVRKMILLK